MCTCPSCELPAALTHVFCGFPSQKLGVRLGAGGLADLLTTLSSNILPWITWPLYEPTGNLCSLNLQAIGPIGPIVLPGNIIQLYDWLTGDASSGATDPERGPTIRDRGL